MSSRWRQGKEFKIPDYITKGAVKVIEVMGVSDRGFEDAVTQGLHKAGETIDGIAGPEVLKQTARIDNYMII